MTVENNLEDNTALLAELRERFAEAHHAAGEVAALLAAVPAAPPCMLCVGDGGNCPRCAGTGTDPDPAAPMLEVTR